MSEPRFVVATVEGYAIKLPVSAQGSHRHAGVSAHVLDSHHLYAVIASFRSEEWGSGGSGGHIMRKGAQQRAHAEADRLNLWAAEAEAA